MSLNKLPHTFQFRSNKWWWLLDTSYNYMGLLLFFEGGGQGGRWEVLYITERFYKSLGIFPHDRNISVFTHKVALFRNTSIFHRWALDRELSVIIVRVSVVHRT